MNNTHESKKFKVDPLVTPLQLIEKYPLTSKISKIILNTRKKISRILTGKDKRLLVVIGPCSIHDPIAALEYAKKLLVLREKFSDSLEIIMRTYFEKPRTVIGWKGLVSDPYLDGSFKINEGLEIARQLLLDINDLQVPSATEFLDTVIAKYIEDLISWGAIGARTTESQIHREMASALSCPIGFKNGTDGNILIAIDAIRAAQARHLFLAPDKTGKISINYTIGNPCAHIIMRGGKQPNYYCSDINFAVQQLNLVNLPKYLMIDFSHANSYKKHNLQLEVADYIAKQISAGSYSIAGVMIESFIEEGSQNVNHINNLTFGKSITDPCLGWNDSVLILEKLYTAVQNRNKKFY